MATQTEIGVLSETVPSQAEGAIAEDVDRPGLGTNSRPSRALAPLYDGL